MKPRPERGFFIAHPLASAIASCSILPGIAHEVFEPTKRRHIVRQNGYGDNFASGRRQAWTH